MQVEAGDVDGLRSQIERAFRNVSKPECLDEALAEPYKRNDDGFELAKLVVEKPWSDLTVLELFRHREALFMLSPLGYRACLPAYLRASTATTDWVDEHGADIRGYLLYRLRPNPGSSDARVSNARAQFEFLTDDQRKAVASTLSYLSTVWNMKDASEILASLSATA